MENNSFDVIISSSCTSSHGKSKTCRCCLKCNEESMQNIFQIISGDQVICEVLTNLTSLNYSTDDGLSQFICSFCCKKLMEFHEFRRKCIENDSNQRSSSADFHRKSGSQIVMIEEVVVQSDQPEASCSRKEFEQIIEVDEDIEIHSCDICNENFDCENSFNLHSKIHDQQSEHKCPMCDKKFESLIKMKRHRNVHRKDILNPENKPDKNMNFNCSLCDKKFVTSSKLQSHLGAHERDNETRFGTNSQRPFGCDRCELRFWDEIKLERHQIIHSDDYEESRINYPPDHVFVCIICMQKITEYENFIEHLNHHKEDCSDKTQFTCGLCSNVYTSLTYIIRHAKGHPENATHLCIYCGKLMAAGDEVITHLLKHRGFKLV